ITGAPKIRTMEIIDQLEWEARGIYTGSIGYFSYNQTAEFNIAIRTIIHQKDQISFGAGGAIIDLSDPEAEFREILVKAYPMIQAVVGAVDATDFLLDEMTGEEMIMYLDPSLRSG
ncbi:MAG: chorismate-binding protein, partial [Bacteroidetes bacterium]|nr:chorismate-binding protein [Bacteroidota bacterium]